MFHAIHSDVDGEVVKPGDGLADDEELVIPLANYVPNTAEERRHVRKIDFALLPFLCWMYVLAYLDRGNIANANAAGMSESLNMKDNVGYFLCEVPSNIIMNKSRPSIYLPTIVWVWGYIVIVLSQANNYKGFLAGRFFLGYIEAGLFPGAIYLLTCCQAILYLLCIRLHRFSLGGIMAGAIVKGLEGVRGIPGWRWLFIVEGALTVVCGFGLYVLLPDYPRNARYFSPDQRRLAQIRILVDRQVSVGNTTRPSLFLGMSISYFEPTILKTMGYTKVTAQWMTVRIWTTGAVCLLALSWASGNVQDRRWHRCGLYGLAAIACIILYTGLPLMPNWTSESIPFPNQKRSIAITFLNSFGHLAIVYGSYLWPSTNAPQHLVGFATLTATCGFGEAYVRQGCNFTQNKLPNCGSASLVSDRQSFLALFFSPCWCFFAATMDGNITKSPPSTEWSKLFAQNPSYEPTTYKALDNLVSHEDLAFLHAKFWNKIRAWTRNDITEMSRIIHPDLAGRGSIFIGGMNHALNEDTLAKNDIQAVIAIHPKDSLAWDKNNTSYGLQRFYPDEKGVISSVVKYPLIIPLEDNANSNLIDHFDETNEFIKLHSSEGRNILIHCKSGRSRSVAVLIAYLQQKFCSEKGLASLKDKTAAKEQMRMHREEITEAIRAQRLPVIVIMERFDELLARYDLKLIDDPEYRSEKTNKLPASEVMDSKTPKPRKQREIVVKKESKVVQTKGGAAVLKLCVAAAFFKNNQKPTEAVVHQFFEVNEAYFYELEALEYKGRSYVGSQHACLGLVEFCFGYAKDDTPSGGKSWGCCDGTSCYIPATCEDASAPDCGGTAASLCPYSPIMKCTYGASSRCVYFIYQTATDDNAKLTSWGCDKTPTTYIIGPLQVEQTASVTASTTDEPDSSDGLSNDATIAIAVVLPVVGLAILVAAAMLFLRRRKKRASKTSAPGEGARSEVEQTTENAPVPVPPPYEMDDNVLRPEIDSREVRYRTN
ncbi:hypothetical protein H9Q74_012132 [Fusarium xylarioides]|nr:hypothetical protein H9Q74_012132 [Fusarium xylarioides]